MTPAWRPVDPAHDLHPRRAPVWEIRWRSILNGSEVVRTSCINDREKALRASEQGARLSTGWSRGTFRLISITAL